MHYSKHLALLYLFAVSRNVLELISARLARNWTQLKLAAHMNVSRSTISNWENGISEPDFGTLCTLSAVLRCDFVPRHAEITDESRPEERKMRLILGKSSEIAVKYPTNAREITAGIVDFRINGSDFLGDTIEFRVIAPFSLEKAGG